MSEKEKWQTRSGRLICIALVLLGVYLLLKYALGTLMPFVLALAVAAVISPVAKRSSKKLLGSVRAWSIFYVCIFWFAVFSVLSYFVFKLSAEAKDFFVLIGERGDEISDSLKGIIDSIISLPSKIPFLDQLAQSDMLENAGVDISGAVSSFISEAAQSASEALTVGVGKLIVGTPKAIIALVVCIISSVYLSADYERIKEYLFGFFREDTREGAIKLLGRIGQGLKGYARAYFRLFLMTFAEVYVGLIILRRSYALFIAFAVALVDILPVLGAGFVLVPWAVVLIAKGEIWIGVGMLVLYAVVAIVRQIAEPRLIGTSLGIHPLASLASMYVGLRFFGFWGMLLGPVTALVIKEIRDS